MLIQLHTLHAWKTKLKSTEMNDLPKETHQWADQTETPASISLPLYLPDQRNIQGLSWRDQFPRNGECGLEACNHIS